MFLRTRFVSRAEYWAAHHRFGSLYFIRNPAVGAVKIGHSTDVPRRLSQLQVGNSNRLELIGCVAAPIAVEPLVHQQFTEGALIGEWFHDFEGQILTWLKGMTHEEPMYRNVWDLVEGQQFQYVWHEDTKTHTKHLWNKKTGKWEPPIE